MRRWGRVAPLLCAFAISTGLPVLGGAHAAGNCVGTYEFAAGGGGSEPADAQICVGRTNEFAGEPTVGATRDGTVVLYPAYQQHPGTSYTRPTVAVSSDGGSTFTLVPPTAAGLAPTHNVDLDPFMYVDPTTGRIFVESNTTGNCDVLSFSDDDAKTWATTTIDGCVTFDHENLFAGPAPAGSSSPSGYPNVVYRCSYGSGMFGTLHTSDMCEKSLDGGVVWTPTGQPAFVYDPAFAVARPDIETTPYGCMDQLGHGTVGPDGTIYLPAGMCGVPEIAISHDEGATWTRSVVSTTVLSHEFNDGVTVNDTAVAVDGAGRLCALWIGRNTEPYLATSSDGGASWSTPLMVAPPGVVSTALPELAADANGQVAMAFMGSTNSPPWPAYVPCQSDLNHCIEQEQADVVTSVSGDPTYADTLWSGYLFVARHPDRARPVFVGGPVTDGWFIRGSCGADNCQAEKDFIDVRFGPDGTAYASYVDACSAACATTPGGTDDKNTGLVARLHLGIGA